MKLIKTIATVVIISINLVSFSQNMDLSKAQKIIVEDITKTISKGSQPGFKVIIPQADKKNVEKQLSKKMESGSKSKVENESNEMFIIGAMDDAIADSTFNIYAILNEYKDYLELNVFYEVGDEFLTKQKNETAYLGAKKDIREFALEMYKEAVEDELKEEEKKLKNLEGEHKKLVNENDKLYKGISEEERSIEKNKDDINLNEADQQRAIGLVQSQKDHMVNLKTEEQIKEAEKTLKGYENDVSKLQKTQENMHKSIDKSEAKIREYERNITDNEHEMALKESEIKKQKDHIFQVEQKLKSIE